MASRYNERNTPFICSLLAFPKGVYALAGNLSIVIVNFRTADLVIALLRSIAAALPDVTTCHIFVVDNDSQDGSTEKLKNLVASEAWHDWVVIVPAARNGGFAYGNNVGITETLRLFPTVDYVMLLNPDTIVFPGSIEALVEFMDATPSAGVAGSLLENADGELEPSAHRAPSPLGELESAARLGVLTRILHRHAVTPPLSRHAHQCDWVSGASLVVRRKVLEAVGAMDEGYFLYYEEVDFCLRVRQAGWQIWFVPASRILHLEGASTGIRHTRQRRAAYWYDSRRRYFVKHIGLAGWILADILWASGRASLALRRLLRLGSGGKLPDPKCFAFDLLWGDFQALVTGRACQICRKD